MLRVLPGRQPIGSAHSALFCCCQCNLFVRCTPRFTRGSFHGWKPDAASKPWKTFHCSPPRYLVTGKHAVVWAQYFSATAVIPHFKFSTHFLRLQNRMLINLLCDKAISSVRSFSKKYFFYPVTWKSKVGVYLPPLPMQGVTWFTFT